MLWIGCKNAKGMKNKRPTSNKTVKERTKSSPPILQR